MSARSLVIGLDGADLDVVRALGPTELPFLHRLMREGTFASLQSVMPPATLPNWLTFLTGTDPGEHGVFDFTVREGYRVRFVGGTVREVPTLAARLDAMGHSCAVLSFPGTWPPEHLEHGIFVSGWDSPVAFEADRSFVWPPDLYDEICDQFGPPRFDDVGELDGIGGDWHERLGGELADRVQRKTELARYLLAKKRWDLFMVYFGESDTAAHHLWSLHDPASPRRPAMASERAQQGLATAYRALDVAVDALVEAAGGEGVEVTVVSDHGSGGSSDKVLYLNRVLESAGLLHFNAMPRNVSFARWAREAALRRLGPRLRQRLFSASDALLPNALESRARFGAIDMTRTIAFSDELNYFPAIHFNVAGREPQGILDSCDMDRATRDVEGALLALVDPWTGAKVVRAVTPREGLFRGPHVTRAPDLLLELHLDGGYSYNLLPTGGAPPGTGPWRKLDPSEYLGKKGRSLPGSHRPKGVWIARGPRVQAAGQIEAHIMDASATLLSRMDVALPGLGGTALAHRDVAPSAKEKSIIVGRLRNLGYID